MQSSIQIGHSFERTTEGPTTILKPENRKAPSSLEFTAQPTNAQVNSIISPAITVSVLDDMDQVVTTDNGREITISLASGSGNLTGTLTTTTVNGVATFDNLMLDDIGAFTLSATATGLTSATSSSFTIISAPGGVSGAIYWLDANDLDGDGTAEGTAGEAGQSGGQVTTWVNKTGGTDFDINAGLSSGTNPDLKEDQMNFNAAIEFNESVTSDYLGAQVTDFPGSAITQFLVLQSNQSSEGVFSYATSVEQNAFLILDLANIEITAGSDKSLTSTDIRGNEAELLVTDRISDGTTNLFNNGTPNGSNAFTIGMGYAPNSSGTIILGQDQDVIGGNFHPAQAYEGQMAEVITYGSVLGTSDRQKVESYLALKYGITLDQNTVSDYLSSSGNSFWDYTENATYVHDVAGIGQDLISGLDQPKSKSRNSDAILTVEKNAAVTLTDGNFLVWANNNGSTTTYSAAEANGTDYSRINRIWRVQEKRRSDGGVTELGNIDLSFDLTGVSYVGANVRLLVGSNDDFDSGTTTTVHRGTILSDVVTFSDVDVDNGEFLAIAVDLTPRLSFSIDAEQPTTTTAGEIMSPVVKVSIINDFDELLTGRTDEISLVFATDPSGGTAVITGGVENAVAGVATFNALSIDVAGSGYALQANASGLTSAVSNTFNIDFGLPSKLLVTVQPTNVYSTATITPGIQISVTDALNNVVTTDTRAISLAINSGPAGAVLSGTTMTNAVGGVATFSDLSLDLVGAYAMIASSDPVLTTAVSNTFSVIQEPGGVAGAMYWLDANDLDADGNPEGTAGETGQSAGQVSTWVDKAGGLKFTNTSGTPTGTTPDLVEDQMNFNPSIEFNLPGNASNLDYLGDTVNDFPSTEITQFLVLRTINSSEAIFAFASDAIPDSPNEFTIFNLNNVWMFAAGANQSGTGADVNDGLTNILTISRLSSSGNTSFYTNADSISSFVMAASTNMDSFGVLILGQEQDAVGGGFSGAQAYQGEIAESITFASVLSDTDRQKVESYLAIKYGITMDQTTGLDYLSSEGTAIWDYSENTTYIHDIGGIGQDLPSGLTQSKSKSRNSDAILTIEKNSGTSLSDGNFLIWGNNDGSTTTRSTAEGAGLGYFRMSRMWRLQEKRRSDGAAADLGGIDLSFDLTGVSYEQSEVVLIIGNDDNFDSGTTTTTHTGTFDGDIVTFSNISVTDGDFLALGLEFAPRLSFTVNAQQPMNTILGNAFSPTVVVTIIDENDMVITGRNDMITLSFANDPTTGAATITNGAVAAVNGVATFTGLSVDMLGAGYTFDATATDIVSTVSNSFDITGVPGGVTTNLNLWLNAGAGTNTTTDGEEITVWSDQSGNSNNTSDPGGSGTISFQNDLADQINFNEVLRFSSALRTMQTPSFVARDVFVVSKVSPSFTTSYGGLFGKLDADFGIRANSENDMEIRWIGNGTGGTDPLFGDWSFGGISHINGINADIHNGLPHILYNSASSAQATSAYFIGGYLAAPSRPLTADIAEVLVYGDRLSDNDREKVQSYLAIKYGLTIDQTTGTDYLSSDGTVVWDYSENSTYVHDIAGIGFDNNSNLYQPKSKSQNDDAVLTIEKNAAVTLTDGDYFIWSNDGGSTTSTALLEAEGTGYLRMSRTWRAQEKRRSDGGATELGNVDLTFDLTGLIYNVGEVNLVIDDDGIFGTGSTIVPVTPTFDGNVATFSDVDIDDGEFFTVTARLSRILSFTVSAQQPPMETVAGMVMTPSVQVSILNEMGGLTARTDEVTLMIENDASTGGAVISEATAFAVSGVATFPSLSINLIGTGYTIRATAHEAASAVSSAFNIIAGDIDVSATGSSISSADLTRVADGIEAAAITMQLRDIEGNIVERAGVDVTFSTTFGDLSATTATTDASGQAVVTLTSPDIGTANVSATIDHDEDGMGGTAQVPIVNGSTVDVTFTSGVPARLLFTLVPAGSKAGITISPAIEVSILDTNDRLVNTATNEITLALNPSSPSAVLTGTLMQTAVGGVATFDDLSIDNIGLNYVLDATATSLTSASSDPFYITGVPGGITTDLNLWLKADAGTNTTTDAAEVTSWSDRSGQGNSASKPGTGSHRTGTVSYQNETSELVNFHPIIHFDAVNKRLETSQFMARDVLLVSKVDNANINTFSGVFGETEADFGVRLARKNASESYWIGTGSEIVIFPSQPLTNNGDWVKLSGGQTLVNDIETNDHQGLTHVSYHSSPDTQDALYNIGGYFLTSSLRNFTGEMGELIVYGSKLGATDLDKVQSYLALRYGITLDQSTATDYVASDGTVIWDSSVASNYNEDIAGIGLDLNGGLVQKQSRSLNPDDIVTIGLSDGTLMEDDNGLGLTNNGNSGMFTADRSFLIWSNNGATLDSAKGNRDFDSNQVNSRIEREWYVQETGTIGDVLVQIDVSNLPGPEKGTFGTSDESQIVLLVDGDGDFTSGATIVNQSFTPTQDGQVNFIVNFDPGDYFTLGSTQFGALPIKLLRFEARRAKKGVLLEWETASEVDHAYFRLDRANGDLDFTPFAYIEPRGSDSQGAIYQYEDVDAATGLNYYRLVDVDLNGVENYSEIILLNFQPEQRFVTALFPNPAKRGTTVTFTGTQLQEIVLAELISVNGVKMGEFNRDERESQTFYYNTMGIPSGVYFVRILDQSNTIHYQKLIVTD